MTALQVLGIAVAGTSLYSETDRLGSWKIEEVSRPTSRDEEPNALSSTLSTSLATRCSHARTDSLSLAASSRAFVGPYARLHPARARFTSRRRGGIGTRCQSRDARSVERNP